MKPIVFLVAFVALNLAGHVWVPNFDSYFLMVALISLLVIAHEWGHYTVARMVGVKVERFGFGLPFGPTLFEKKVGETTYCIHLLLLGGYVSFPDDDPDSEVPADSPRRFENRSIPERSAIAVAGVTVNAILGYLLILLVFAAWGYPTVATGVEKLLSKQSPAAVAGLMPGDRIVRIADRAVDTPEILINTLGEYKNTPVTVEIVRANAPKTLTVRPNAHGKIEIQLKSYRHYRPFDNPLAIPGAAAQFLTDQMRMNFQAMGEIITGKRSVRELSGPVGIIGQGGRMIAEQGLPVGLMITAFISVILAIMNILPIPMLDGGHLLFMLIEKIQGHPLKKELQEKIIQVSFVVLMVFMAFILFNDVNTHVLGH